MWISAAVFVGVLGIVLGAYMLFVVRPERGLLVRLTPGGGAVHRVTLTKQDTDASTGVLRHLLETLRPVVTPVHRFVRQSGVPITTAVFLLITGCAALAAYVAVVMFTHSVLFALPAALVAGAVMPLYVRHARARRLMRFEEQLPDAVDLIGRALRAGHALTTGIGMVADEFGDPIGTEFRTLYDEQNFGLTLHDAMRNFAERVPAIDARFFVTAVLTQHEAGGNLAEVLDNLSSVIRDRFRVKRQIRVISTHGRLTGLVLVMLPPVLAAGFLLMSGNHMQLLMQDSLGVRMIIAAIVLQVTGALIIRRIVNVEY